MNTLSGANIGQQAQAQHQAAQNAYGPIVPSPSPTLMDALEGTLKTLLEGHQATLARQYQVMARLDGPIPTREQTAEAPKMPGQLGRISALLDVLVRQMGDYDEVTKRLERLA